jgi:hypothetical protein
LKEIGTKRKGNRTQRKKTKNGKEKSKGK